MYHRSTTLPLYFWNCGSNSDFFRWHKSVNEAKWTLLLFFCASFMTSFLHLTFLTSHAGTVSSFFYSLSTGAFASGIFIACGIGTNVRTKLYCNTDVCAFPAMCSSWILFVTDSILCLVHSCASVIQLNLVFASDVSASSVFETMVSRMHAWENALLHGIAAAFDVSKFRLAFLVMSLYSSSLGSIK